MQGENRECFEYSLELEHFLAELQAGQVARLPMGLTLTQARVYRMAMLFHVATSGKDEPSAEFASQLQARLEAELQVYQQAQAARP